jgi:endonuclease/exonuclease/phosphatase family metal-dependent hydrolase
VGPQVIGGDFNADPHERSIRAFTHKTADTCYDDGTSTGSNKDADFGTCDSADSDGQHQQGSKSLFKDSYLHASTVVPHGSPENVSHTTPPWAELGRGYTFPSCNPVKRIDFLLVRNGTCTGTCTGTGAGASTATIAAHWVVGTEPGGRPPPSRAPTLTGRQAQTSISVTGDSDFNGSSSSSGSESENGSGHSQNRHLYNEIHRTAELGMLDAGSPLWASDHFGVVVELLLKG